MSAPGDPALLPTGRSRAGRPVSLRLARGADEAVMLAWQQDPTTRRFARNPEVPTPSEHHRWLRDRLRSSDCLLTVIEHDGAAAGVLRLDLVRAQSPRPTYEVSIVIAPEQRGRGIALEALRLARGWRPGVEFVARILPGNRDSEALFEAAGYRRAEDGLLHLPPAEPRTAEAER